MSESLTMSIPCCRPLTRANVLSSDTGRDDPGRHRLRLLHRRSKREMGARKARGYGRTWYLRRGNEAGAVQLVTTASSSMQRRRPCWRWAIPRPCGTSRQRRRFGPSSRVGQRTPRPRREASAWPWAGPARSMTHHGKQDQSNRYRRLCGRRPRLHRRWGVALRRREILPGKAARHWFS
jgi:hypothetical protein